MSRIDIFSSAPKYETVEHESEEKTEIYDPIKRLRSDEKAPEGEKDPS